MSEKTEFSRFNFLNTQNNWQTQSLTLFVCVPCLIMTSYPCKIPFNLSGGGASHRIISMELFTFTVKFWGASNGTDNKHKIKLISDKSPLEKHAKQWPNTNKSTTLKPTKKAVNQFQIVLHLKYGLTNAYQRLKISFTDLSGIQRKSFMDTPHRKSISNCQVTPIWKTLGYERHNHILQEFSSSLSLISKMVSLYCI